MTADKIKRAGPPEDEWEEEYLPKDADGTARCADVDFEWIRARFGWSGTGIKSFYRGGPKNRGVGPIDEGHRKIYGIADDDDHYSLWFDDAFLSTQTEPNFAAKMLYTHNCLGTERHYVERCPATVGYWEELRMHGQ